LRVAGMGGFAADYGFETKPHALSLKRLVALPAQANQEGKVCDRYQRQYKCVHVHKLIGPEINQS